MLTLAEKGGAGAEVIRAAPGFRLVATMNPGACCIVFLFLLPVLLSTRFYRRAELQVSTHTSCCRPSRTHCCQFMSRARGCATMYATRLSSGRLSTTAGGDFGKKELSPALANRFTTVWVPAISDDAELAAILASRLPGGTAWLHCFQLLVTATLVVETVLGCPCALLVTSAAALAGRLEVSKAYTPSLATSM